MDIKQKIELVSRFTEEVMTPDDLSLLLSKDEKIQHYIGFEISGKIYLGCA